LYAFLPQIEVPDVTSGFSKLRKEKDMEQKPRIAIVAVVREFDLQRAEIVRKVLDDLLPQRNLPVPQAEARAEVKQHIVEGIAELAEMRYLAEVRRLAMDLMEYDRSLTAADAAAQIEVTILEAALG
jgi:hypothetical protein